MRDITALCQGPTMQNCYCWQLDVDALEERRAIVDSISSRGYFTRAWTKLEFNQGQQLKILCGRYVVDLDFFEHVLR